MVKLPNGSVVPGCFYVFPEGHSWAGFRCARHDDGDHTPQYEPDANNCEVCWQGPKDHCGCAECVKQGHSFEPYMVDTGKDGDW